MAKADLAPAIALNSLGINISRAIRPRLGGLILSFAGPAVVFRAQRAFGAGRGAGRWCAGSRSLPGASCRRSISSRRCALGCGCVEARAFAAYRAGAGGGVLSCSAAQAGALLPLVARQELGLGPGGYALAPDQHRPGRRGRRVDVAQAAGPRIRRSPGGAGQPVVRAKPPRAGVCTPLLACWRRPCCLPDWHGSQSCPRSMWPPSAAQPELGSRRAHWRPT
ncbi:MFS transporter [Cupriavidus basilensis]